MWKAISRDTMDGRVAELDQWQAVAQPHSATRLIELICMQREVERHCQARMKAKGQLVAANLNDILKQRTVFYAIAVSDSPS